MFHLHKTPLSDLITVTANLRDAASANSWAATDAAAATATLSAIGLDLSKVKHGIGNLRESVIPQDYISVFEYSFDYVVTSHAGRPLLLNTGRTGCSGIGGGGWDKSRFFIGTVLNTTSEVGAPNKPVGCEGPTDVVGNLGCTVAGYTGSITNCELYFVMSPGSTPSCYICAQGYMAKTTTTFYSGYYSHDCQSRPSNCKRCNSTDGCLVCNDNYKRQKPGATYTCTALIGGSTNIYNPSLQSEYAGTSVVGSSFALNGAVYESVNTFTVANTGTVIIEVNVTVPYSSSETAKYDLNMYVGGQLVQVRSVPYLSGNPASYTAKFYAVLHNQPAGNLEVKFTSLSSGATISGGLKTSIQEYNMANQCLFQDNTGECLRCNNNLGYYLLNRVCTALPSRKYVIYKEFGINDQIGNCYDTTAVVKCTGPNSGDATVCATGYFLTAGTCPSCNTNCHTCGTSALNCLTCSGGTPYLQPGSPNTCVAICNSNQFNNSGTCTDCHPSCLACTQAGTTGCASCVTGKFLDGSNSCQACNNPCTVCTAAGNTACTSCIATYQPTNYAYCYKCDSSCATCSGPTSTQCLTCPTQHYRSSGQCLACAASCNECAGAGNNNCVGCQPGFQQSGSLCYVCDSSCETCNGPSTTQCLTCPSQFYLSGGQCLACNSACNECTAAGNTNCSACNPGFRQSGNSCFVCDSTCSTCNGPNPTNCLTCPAGRGLIGGACITCHSSCNSCIDSTSTGCTSCSCGKYLAGNSSCQLCDSTCSTCNGVTTTACLTCGSGHFLHTDNSCKACDGTCSECLDASATSCSACPADRNFTTTNCLGSGCCYICDIANCLTCSQDRVCATCTSGYELNDRSCLKSGSNSENQEHIRVIASVNRNNWNYELTFSKDLNPSRLNNRYTLTYDKKLFSIDFHCFERNETTNFCTSRINFKEGTEVKKEQITLEIDSETVSQGGVYIPGQSVPLEEPVSYFIDSISLQKTLNVTSKTTSAVAMASQGLGLFTSGSSFSSFVKLTQHIEMVLYFNVYQPVNFEAFVKFFSDNIISISYNPIGGLFNEKCNLPWAFVGNGIDCVFLGNTGQYLTFICGLAFVKLIVYLLIKCMKNRPMALNLLKPVDSFLNFNLAIMIADTLMFDFVLAGMVAVKSANFSSGTSALNFMLGLGSVVFYVVEIGFVYFYCKFKYSEKINQKAKEEETLKDPFEIDIPMEKAKGLTPTDKIKRKSIESQSPRENQKQAWIAKMPIIHYFDQMNIDYLSGRYCILVNQIRVFLSTVILVFLFDYPFVQVGIITAMQLLQCIWFSIKRPHSSKKENFKCIFTEALLAVTMILCIPLINGSGLMESQSDRFYYFGYTMIAISSSIFLCSIAFTVYESVHEIFQYCKKLRNRSIGKVQPQTGDASPVNLRSMSSKSTIRHPSPINKGLRPGKDFTVSATGSKLFMTPRKLKLKTKPLIKAKIENFNRDEFVPPLTTITHSANKPHRAQFEQAIKNNDNEL